MNSLSNFIHKCSVNAGICTRINHYLKDKGYLYRLVWMDKILKSGKILPLDQQFITVIPEDDNETSQVLQAFQAFLYSFHRKVYRKINNEFSKALDYALLRGLALSMDTEAIEIFHENYLALLEGKPEIQSIYQKLSNLDDRGLLQSVFMKELFNLPANGKDYSEELAGLIEFLRLPTRDYYLNGDIRIALYDKNFPVPSEISRVCCDRIYVSQLTPRGRSVRITAPVPSEAEQRVFKRKIQASRLKPGEEAHGWVMRVESDVVLFDLDGMQGILFKEDFGWHRLQKSEVFHNGDFCDIQVESIDYKQCRIYLSNRKETLDPRKTLGFPEIYTIVKTHIVREFHTYMVGLYRGTFEIMIPKEELPEKNRYFPSSLIGTSVPLLIYYIDDKSRLYGSIKKTHLDNNDPHIPYSSY